MARRRYLNSLFTEDGAFNAFVRNHAAAIREAFGLPPHVVPVSDETPLFEPTMMLRPRPAPRRPAKKGGRRC